MVSFFVIFISSMCLLSGFSAGYHTDIQYRQSAKKHAKITVPSQVRWLYKFKWDTGPQVLLYGFLMETSGIISTLVVVTWGCLCIFVPVLQQYSFFPFVIFVVHGCNLLFISIIIATSQRHGVRRSANHKNWICELEFSLFGKQPHRKLIVLSFEKPSHSAKKYRVRCKVGLGKEYIAIAYDNYAPQIGDCVDAIYIPSGSFFILVPPSTH